MEDIQSYFDLITSMVIEYAPRLALAIIALVVGLRIADRLAKMAGSGMKHAGVGDDIRPFLVSFASISLKVLLAFSVASIIGVDMTSFIAVLAAAGFAVGLALQGSLSNFAAGVLILLFRPYKTGDWVEVEDKFGKVEAVQIFNTIIVTPGSKTLIVPNAKVIDGVVTNYSKKGLIRMELRVTMPYEESFPKVRDIILGELKQVSKVLEHPEPEVGIENFDSHSVLIAVRPYLLPDDFWEVHFEIYERIKAAFHAHNIKVAYSEGVELGTIGL